MNEGKMDGGKTTTWVYLHGTKEYLIWQHEKEKKKREDSFYAVQHR